MQAIDVPDPVDNFICETSLRAVENLRRANVASGAFLSTGQCVDGCGICGPRNESQKFVSVLLNNFLRNFRSDNKEVQCVK